MKLSLASFLLASVSVVDAHQTTEEFGRVIDDEELGSFEVNLLEEDVKFWNRALRTSMSYSMSMSMMMEYSEDPIEEEKLLVEELPTVMEILTTAGNYETFATLLDSSEVSYGEGYTYFAPTDDAFDALPSGVVECLLEPSQATTLENLVKHHIQEGLLTSNDLTHGSTVTTARGSAATVSVAAGNILIDEATIVAPNMIGSDGIIHGINAVLIPYDMDLDELVDACTVVVDSEEGTTDATTDTDTTTKDDTEDSTTEKETTTTEEESDAEVDDSSSSRVFFGVAGMVGTAMVMLLL
eukprot:Nitzschia sp. Nitz4//scaffold139_size61406//13656//14627//NITZ4_006449-RA/size61406-snap-gene-0.1-mRNA-1//1//CDS//3329535819//1691//frame0